MTLGGELYTALMLDSIKDLVLRGSLQPFGAAVDSGHVGTCTHLIDQLHCLGLIAQFILTLG